MEAEGKVVVIGDDFGPMGDDAILAGLAELASGAAAVMHVMHVYEPGEVMDRPGKPAFATQEELLAEAPSALENRVAYLATLASIAYDSSKVHAHARLGKIVETLLQTCVDYDADLLIVGTHGRTGIDRFMLGSVAEQLVRRAGCPVLVARPKDYYGQTKTPLPDAPSPGAKARTPQSEAHEPVSSTTMESWHPSDNGPTGFRIV